MLYMKSIKPKCTRDAPETHLKCTRNTPRVHPQRTTNAFDTHPECTRNAAQMHPTRTTNALEKHTRNAVKGVGRVRFKCIPGAPGVCCFGCVSGAPGFGKGELQLNLITYRWDWGSMCQRG